jgi:hypothetical protein
MFEGREPYQQAIDKLERARIEFLEDKMDYYAEHGMAEEFKKAKEEGSTRFVWEQPGEKSTTEKILVECLNS